MTQTTESHSRGTEPGSETPLQYLRQLEERVRRAGGSLPGVRDDTDKWAGVCCELMSHQLLISLDDIAEVLEGRELTEIPGCQHWVLGVLNLRGRLLPVFSAGGFLTGRRFPGQPDRVIAVDSEGLFCGIAVDVLYGMNKFPLEAFRDPEPAFMAGQPDELTAYMGQCLDHEDSVWYQFDMMALAQRMLSANPTSHSQ